MRNRVLQFTVALSGGLALPLALALLVNQAIPVRADPGVLYVAPGANCNGASPCYESVQAAVADAASGDEIRVAAGTYTGVTAHEGVTQTIYISKTVTIRGGYTTNWTTPDPEANPTTLDAQGQGRVIYITGDISPTIEGLRITGGDATGLGGFSGRATGGGVYVYAATATISNCMVYSNTASTALNGYGGGLALGNSDATLSGNTVVSNTASTAAYGEGGGLALSGSAATLSGNTVQGNVASTAGAGSGGGLFLGGSAATLSGNTVQGNVASTVDRGLGGGLYLGGSAATLSGNMLINNTATLVPAATGKGGGLWVFGSSPFTLTNNLVADNHANTEGSGLWFDGDPWWPNAGRLLHTTIADNRGSGQGVFVEDCTTLAFTNTIIAGHNSVGVYVTTGSTATLESTLWYDNGAHTGGGGTVLTGTVNIYDDPAFVESSVWDYHIIAASAAMDVGIEAGVTTDIDDHHRPYGSVPDIGADEVFAPSVPPDIESTLVYTDTWGNPAVIQVPAGAVTETTNLIYIPIDTVTPPSGFAFANRAFDLDAYRDGALLPSFTFSAPVTITVHYAEADVVGRGEDRLVLNYWDGSGWVDAASTCTPTSTYGRHPDENWLTVPVCHLSRFALLEEKYTVYLPLTLRNY